MLHALHGQDIGACVGGNIINNLRFADDIALIAETEADLQQLVTMVHKFSTQFGLKISITKTEVQVISKEPKNVNIKIAEHSLEQVKSFVYLGGAIYHNARCEQDVRRRIGLAHGAMQSLNTIWIAKDISPTTKVSLYQTLVLSIVLYSAETWTLKAKDLRRLNTFEMSCLRKILGVSRRDRLRNDFIRNSLGLNYTILDKIHQKRLTYFGHITRMDTTRYPKITLEGHVHAWETITRVTTKTLDRLCQRKLRYQKIGTIRS
jgi:predicted DNA binding CopG/RHH family protein